uniref:Uncharacterized protein n=1 Tax=Davidia involucrata TaxID=16924 RepID=A0A5B6ZA39_DAVIN
MLLTNPILSSSNGSFVILKVLIILVFNSIVLPSIVLSPFLMQIGLVVPTLGVPQLVIIFSLVQTLSLGPPKRKLLFPALVLKLNIALLLMLLWTCWLYSFLHDLHVSLSKPTVIFYDNVSATYLAANPVNHARIKHIEIDLHFVREHVSWGSHHVQHISTHEQLADIFTKGLPSFKFMDFRSNLCVLPHPPSIARG